MESDRRAIRNQAATMSARSDDWFNFGGSGALATFDEIWQAARQRLPADVWDFLEGGAGRELAVRRNLEDWDRWQLVPRVMSGCSVPDLSTSFLGIPLSLPVLSAPFGGDALFHPEGQVAVARANERFGIASVVPEGSSFALEEIARAAPAAARIMQLHPVGDPRNVAELIRRAKAAGYAALCVTVDCPVNGWRERNLRNRFNPPLEYFTANYPSGGAIDPAAVFGEMMRPRGALWSWSALAEVCDRLSQPWLAKGILTARDARAAVEAGAAGIVVSNHGGRQLDSAPSALAQLPEVVAEVGGEIAIALDGGVRHGTDIVKALALGAQVVLVGRAVAAALAADGQDGVLALYELLRSELETQLWLMGCADLGALSRDVLRPADLDSLGHV